MLELAEQHKKEMSESLNAKKQVEKLGGLCRALKDQLNELRKQQQYQKESQKLEDKQNEQELTSAVSPTTCCRDHPGDDHHLHEAEKTKGKTVENSMEDSNLIHQNNHDNTNLNCSTINQSDFHATSSWNSENPITE
ncbi:unnamed protein product [Schistosoma mattheei]|uniref:Uncharacterized protein n=1 Tax=Schistosoma mattheei TaxID=31246 RepID=A0A3P8FUS4_9TREM|nr:unnamed protein product [Schistosoma mattheei]